MTRNRSNLTLISRWCVALAPREGTRGVRRVRSRCNARLLRITLLAIFFGLVVALEPAAAQGNPVCSEESGTLVNMIEGFIQITTALGLMGLLVVWQADELADMFTMNQQQALALKQHKRQAMKSAAILVLLGPLFTIAGSAMNLPIAQCVDLTPL